MPSKFQETIKKKKDPITQAIEKKQSIAPGAKGAPAFRGDGYTIENGVRYDDDPMGNVALKNETGKTTGVVKGGRALLGLSKQDAAKLAPEGTVTAQEIAQQQQLAQQAGAIGQVGNIGQLQDAPVDIGQAATAGLVGNVPGLIKNVGTGVAGGFIAGGPALAVVGGIGGAIKSIWGGVQSNIEGQKKGEIAASVDVLGVAKTNMRQLAMLASQDPANAPQYIQAYNDQLTQVHKAYRQIKIETDENLDKYIEDGTDILSDFDLFLREGGTADIYGTKLRIALSSNTPIPLTEADFPEQ